MNYFPRMMSDVRKLQHFVGQIFAIAVGSAITRSADPNAAIEQFQQEINQLAVRPYSNAPWAAIDELSECRS